MSCDLMCRVLYPRVEIGIHMEKRKKKKPVTYEWRLFPHENADFTYRNVYSYAKMPQGNYSVHITNCATCDKANFTCYILIRAVPFAAAINHQILN